MIIWAKTVGNLKFLSRDVSLMLAPKGTVFETVFQV
uniref:Uncharacterized protein n=1 Tax=Anguilla anguilla TaxID=7936 RepID=A0A0E9SEZ5_ANGAN